MNDIVKKPARIMMKKFFILFFYFLLLQGLTALIISSAIIYFFSSGIDLFGYLVNLYLIYFALPFTWAWVAGLSSSVIYQYFSSIKGIVFITIFLLWIIAIFYLEYKMISFNIFVENGLPYIDHLSNLLLHNEKIFFMLIYIFCTIVAVLAIIISKRLIFGFALSSTVFILLTVISFHVQKQENVEEELKASDIRLYQHIKDNQLEKNEMSNNWRITEVKLEPESQHPIQIEITLEKKQAKVRFSINEQFSIARIESQGKSLTYNQKGSSVEVDTDGVESMVLLYEKTIGTSFYPLMSKTVYLPAEANWYPQSTTSEQYVMDSSGILYPNVNKNSCKHFEIVLGKEYYHWKGKALDCLTIIKGPYKKLEIPGMDLLVYKPFLTKKENYIEMQNHLSTLRDELCRTFEIKDSNYCTNKIKSINIIPKSHSTSSLSIYDSTVSNGNYTFFVDSFLNVNYKPINLHIQELSPFLIPYRLLEDEKLSLFIGQYLIEKFKIDSIGYLEFVLKASPISSDEWDRYLKLTAAEKEEVILNMVREIRSEH